MHLSICKFTQTFRGVLEELPNFLKLDNDRQNSTKSKLTGNPKPCYNKKIYSDKFYYYYVFVFSEREHSKQKGRFCIAAKTPFFVVSNEKNADIS
jgi:hypothetical protein|nr:MAG: hypothetical protein [Bacteriophage sp.]